MFAWRIFCKEKAATGEIALMRCDSSFLDVNHIITSSGATRDKENDFVALYSRPRNIRVRLLTLPRLIRGGKNWKNTKMKKMGRQQWRLETNRSLLERGKICCRCFYTLVKRQRDATVLLSHDFSWRFWGDISIDKKLVWVKTTVDNVIMILRGDHAIVCPSKLYYNLFVPKSFVWNSWNCVSWISVSINEFISLVTLVSG